LIIPDSVTTIGRSAFERNEKLESLTIGKSVKTIGNSAFAGCFISELVIGESVETIGRYAFTYNRLKSLTIPASVTTIGDRAFYCSKMLESLTLGKSVKSIGDEVLSSSALRELIFDESLETIGDNAFADCVNLTSVSAIPKSVTSIGYGPFTGCDSLERIEVEKGSQSYESDDGILFNKGKTVLVQYPAKKDNSYTIPETVVEVSSHAFEESKFLESIIIQNGVTSLGASAFENCKKLQTVTIPNSVTSIQERCFASCPLETITIPSSVTSIGDESFLGCNILKTVVYLGEGDPGNQSNDVFKNCRLLLICVPDNYNSDKFCGMNCINHLDQCDAGTATGNCGEGITWDLVFDTGVLTVKGDGYMNDACNLTWEQKRLVTSIVIEDGVKSIAPECFSYCNAESVIIGETVEVIGGYAFLSTSMKTVTIPNSVKEIGDEAFGFSKIEQVIFGDSLETIGNETFFNCESLTSITIPKTVTSIGYGPFIDCDNLERIEVEEGNQYYESEDGVLFNKGKTLLIQYPLPKEDASYTIPETVVEVGIFAFRAQKHLESITIPNGLRAIDKSAFFSVSQLQSVIIPATVNSIEKEAFYGCSSLQFVVYLGEKDPGEDSVNVFDRCTNLTKICVPEDYDSQFFCGKYSLLDLSQCGIHN